MAAPFAQKSISKITLVISRSLRVFARSKYTDTSIRGSKLLYANRVTSHRLQTLHDRNFSSWRSGGAGARAVTGQRTFSVGTDSMSQAELKKKIDSLTDEFMEARDLLADARESKGTTYFSDDLNDAKTAVEDTLSIYKALLEELNEEQTQQVLRTIGLKMQELGAQLQMIEDELLE